jgi:uncharacterized membrane protein YeiH
MHGIASVLANESLALWLDLIGVFAFAVSGALLAARRGFDIVGSLVLATMAGLGGGIIRDLIIAQGVPASFRSIAYLAPPVAATLLVYLFSSRLHGLNRWIQHFDAAGLALFCITGTDKALAAGLSPVVAALLGVTTACGGGMLRDIAANKVPSVFDHRDIYALPAMLGAGLTSLAAVLGFFSLPVGLGIAVLVFALRELALHYSWHAPLAARGWTRPLRFRQR